jgi:hypothetical protein
VHVSYRNIRTFYETKTKSNRSRHSNKSFSCPKFLCKWKLSIIGCSKYLDVSQPSVYPAIKEVTNALNNPEIFNRWVHFPNNFEQLNNVRLNFSQKHGFPGVIGCIDCTHVAIVCPPGFCFSEAFAPLFDAFESILPLTSKFQT